MEKADARQAARSEKARRSLRKHPDVVAEALCQMTDDELVRTLQTVFAQRLPEATPLSKFFLGIGYDLESDSPPLWSVGAVAWPPEERTTDERGFAQRGTCRSCQVRVASWEKDAICPLCGIRWR